MGSQGDYFSRQATAYAQFRPTYPPELFAFVASLTQDHSQVWDCATGSGQAAVGLAPYFERVVATDLSAQQIAQAVQRPNIEYRQAPAASSGLPDASVSLVTVATAAHWLDTDAFYDEVRRVSKPQGRIAVWAYRQPTITPAVDERMHAFYFDVVYPYWPSGREKVDQNYETLYFPFDSWNAPLFESVHTWNFHHLVGYLQTWSALNQMVAQTGQSPLPDFLPSLAQAWGPAETCHTVRFPLFMRVGEIHSTL